MKQSVPKRVTEKSNMERIIKLLQDKGVDPFKSTYIVEIGQSSSRRGTIMQECSPCLTKTRCSQGGHWVTTHGRKLRTSEMLALQNMTPDRVKKPDNVSEPIFQGMIGNSMSVNIIETILAMLSRAAPTVLRVETPTNPPPTKPPCRPTPFRGTMRLFLLGELVSSFQTCLFC